MTQKIPDTNTEKTLFDETARCTLALSDDFESVYDIDLETGDYIVQTKNDTGYATLSRDLVYARDFFGDSAKNAPGKIHPEDLPEHNRIITKDYIIKTLETEPAVTWNYRLLVNNKYLWYRLRIVYKDSTKTHIIIGVFNAEEEMRAKQAQERAARQKENVIKRLSGGVSLYIVNPETDEYEIIVRTQELQDKYGKEDSFTRNLVRYVNEDVFEADRDRVLSAADITTIEKRLAEANPLRVEYRNISSGIPKWYELEISRYQTSEIYYTFANRDREITMRRVHDKQDRDYFCLFVIDADTDLLTVIKPSPWFRTADTGESIPYSPMMQKFASGLSGDAQKFFMHLSSLDYLRTYFAKEDKYTFNYFSSYVDGGSWITVESHVISRHEDGTPQSISLGFIYLDENGAEREEMRELIEKQKTDLAELVAISDYFLNSFAAFFYINLKTGEITLRRLPEHLKDFTGLSGTDNRKTVLYNIISHIVHEDDRKKVYSHLLRENIRKRLKNAPSYSFTYRDILKNPEGDVFRCTIIRGEDEDHAAITCLDINEEVRAERERKTAAARDAAVISGLSDDFSCVTYVNSENGDEVHYRFDAVLSENIPGWKEITNFTERMRRLASVVHPKDREFFQNADAVKEKILSALEKDGVFYHNFRVVTGGETIYYQIKLIPDENAPKHIIAGIRNVDKTVRREMEYQEELDKRIAFLSYFLEQYTAAYYASLDDLSWQIYKHPEKYDNDYPLGGNFTDVIGRFLKADVHPDDLKTVSVLTNPAELKKRLANVRGFSLTFRSLSGGAERIMQCEVLRGADAHHAAFGFMDITQAVLAESERLAAVSRDAAVISCLSDDFSCVTYVNVHGGDEVHYRFDAVLSENIPGWKEITNITERMLKLAAVVHPEDRAFFLDPVAGKREIDEALEKDGVFYHNFRVKINGETIYYQLKVIRDENSADHVIAGIRNVDKTIRRELAYQEELEQTAADLADKNRALLRMNDEVVELLGDVVESRDGESGMHIKRVKGFTRILASCVMTDLPEYRLTPELVNLMSTASALHDVGKIMIPDAILLKPGRLTPEEFEIMKTHSKKGCKVLQKAPIDWSREYLRISLDMCMYHHEKWDGKGYPCGLKGDEIPIAAQIVSIADIYDALVSERCYKKAYSCDKAFEMIVNGECGAFSKKLLACFAKCKDRFEQFTANIASLERINAGQAGMQFADLSKANRDEINQAVSDALSFVFESIFHIDLENNTFAAFHSPKSVLKDRVVSQDTDFFAVMGDSIDLMVHQDDRRDLKSFLSKEHIIKHVNEGSAVSRQFRVMNGKEVIYYRLKATRSSIDLHHCILALENIDSEIRAREELARITNLANRDVLTGVGSARWYAAKKGDMNQVICEGKGAIRPFALVVCDANNLKEINDRFGHDKGDVYLKQMCSTICDIFAHSRVFRTGGDEFVAILEGRDYGARDELLARARDAVQKALESKAPVCERLSFACGMGVFEPGSDTDVDDVFRRADAEMYRDKKRVKEI